MKDPVFDKLKDDAGLMLNDLMRAFTHRPAQKPSWQSERVNPVVPPVKSAAPVTPAQSGLCYFHLN